MNLLNLLLLSFHLLVCFFLSFDASCNAKHNHSMGFLLNVVLRMRLLLLSTSQTIHPSLIWFSWYHITWFQLQNRLFSPCCSIILNSLKRTPGNPGFSQKGKGLSLALINVPGSIFSLERHFQYHHQGWRGFARCILEFYVFWVMFFFPILFHTSIRRMGGNVGRELNLLYLGHFLLFSSLSCFTKWS